MTTITRKSLPGMPGIVAVMISADSAAKVQAEINRIFEQLCEREGVAEFRNPYRHSRGWSATGYYTEAPDEKTETQD